jgi:3-mercaptopropionate dioxygenase
MNYMPARAALDAMLAEIAEAARVPLEGRPQAVARAIGMHVASPALLAGVPTPCCAERYIRHLLHEDAAGGWAVAALVWRPGQMSPVHAHRSWCAVGVHRGVLAESHYRPAAIPVPTGLQLRHPGETTYGGADPNLIHRLANLGCEIAISIHAYGLPYARFCTDLNLILGD